MAIPIVLLWIIKLPTIQLDSSNQRIIPDPLMPIADTTKIPWTIIFGLFLAFYFIGSRFKDSKNMKRTMSISWVLLPLFIFSWIFKKPEIDLPTILGQDIPIFIGIFLIGALTITFINNPIVEKYFSIYLGVLIAITGIALFISIPILLKSALLKKHVCGRKIGT